MKRSRLKPRHVATLAQIAFTVGMLAFCLVAIGARVIRIAWHYSPWFALACAVIALSFTAGAIGRLADSMADDSED